MQIVFVNEPKINWIPYLEFCRGTPNGQPTRALDASSLKFNEPLSFALTLNELIGKTTEPMCTLRNGDLFLESINIGIIIDEISTPWYATINKIDLSNQIYLLQGNLRQWKFTVRGNLTSKKDEDSTRRTIFGSILLEFEARHYGLIWDSYSKTMLADGTFILEEK